MWGVGSLSWVVDKLYDEPERDIAPNVQTVGATDGQTVSKIGNNPANDVVLMQYTGLKDKNGREIYVGDIVLIYERREVIEWDKYQCGFNPFCWQIPSAADCYSEWTFSDNGEVIGNIWENPELLKEL